MSETLRAVYENGHLRLLDPVELTDGQEIRLVILTERDRARAALRDLVAYMPPADHSVDETALMRELDIAAGDQRPLSADIIAERREGP